MERRGGSLPLPDRRHALGGPTPELHAHLQRRLRVIEGVTSSGSLGVGAMESAASTHQPQHHTISQRAIHARSSSPTSTPSRNFFASSSSGMSSAKGGSFPLCHATSGPARYNLACPPPSTTSAPTPGKSSAVAAPCASLSLMSASTSQGFGTQPQESPPSGFRSPPTPRALQNGGALESSRMTGSPVRRIETIGSPWNGYNLQGGKASKSVGSKVQHGYYSSDRGQDSIRKVGDTSRLLAESPLLTERNCLTNSSVRSSNKDARFTMCREQWHADHALFWSQLEALKNKVEDEAAAKDEALTQKASIEKQLRSSQETCDCHSERLKMQQEQINRESKEREKLARNIEDLHLSSQQDKVRLKEIQEVLELRNNELAQANVKLKEQMQKHASAVQENERLIVQMAQLQGERNCLEMELVSQQELMEDKLAVPPAAGPESRLRSAMTNPSTSTEELQQAVKGVEVLLSEARREVSSRLHREKRAAYERLHAAEAQDDEIVLEKAIAEARRTGISEEDITQTESKLCQLRSLTEEEKSAKAAKEMQSQRKARAFLLVKKDDGTQLAKLLDEAEKDGQGARWQDWRDHAGRTLLQFSRELQTTSVQRLLANLLPTPHSKLLRIEPKPEPLEATVMIPGLGVASSQPNAKQGAIEEQTHSGKPPQISIEMRLEENCGPASPMELSPNARTSEDHSTELPSSKLKIAHCSCDFEWAREFGIQAENERGTDLRGDSEMQLSDEEAEWKAQALRAVVKDDTAALAEVLDRLPVESWAHWKNKAGKDLITLAEERGSSGAYSLLARLLGLLKEMRRESFDDREAVWVLIQGEVQPRRATVVADMSEDAEQDAEQVLVEFWDDDAPPSRIDRRSVMKTY